MISWIPVSLEEARGFFLYHIVFDSSRSARIVEVPYNETSVNITDLDPQLMYTLTVRVAVVSETGQLLEGPSSSPITINSTLSGLIINVISALIYFYSIWQCVSDCYSSISYISSCCCYYYCSNNYHSGYYCIQRKI